MHYRNHLATSEADSARRAGAVSIYFLLAIPVLCLAVAVALYSAQLNRARTDVHRTADAAALAAVQTLVDDRMLMSDPQALFDLFEEARQEAQYYATENPAYGDPIELRSNQANDPEGDIVFGTFHPGRTDYVVADFGQPTHDWMRLVNAVRVTAQRSQARGTAANLNDGPLLSRTPTDIIRYSTAIMDRSVIGFRQVDHKPIPLAPFALLSDPTGEIAESWESQVEQQNGPDAWRFDRHERKCRPAADGDTIHEMVVRLRAREASGESQDGEQAQRRPNGCLLQIGTQSFSSLCQQFVAGVVSEHLAEFGGKFVLDLDNTLIVPGSPLGPQPNSAEHALLLKSLQQLQLLGEPRIWPLFSRFDEGAGLPVVTGFVAARLTEVRSEDNGDILFVLQPCVLSLVGAITESSRRGQGEAPPINRYLCRVRLVE
jgi:hypothetical protein